MQKLISLKNRVSDAYWHWRGKRTVSVGGASATFDTSKKIYTGTTARSVRIFLEGERHVVSNLVSELDTDDVFYDIGAHIGFYSCVASSLVSNGQVITFEPDKRDHEVLQSNIELNHPERTKHHAVLLSSERGKQRFHGGSMADGDGVPVDVYPLDEYRIECDLPDPTVMKIDIEGAEVQALKGAVNSLSTVRTCYIEAHVGNDYDRSMQRFGDSEAELHQFLENQGFEVSELGRRGNEVHLKATKESS